MLFRFILFHDITIISAKVYTTNEMHYNHVRIITNKYLKLEYQPNCTVFILDIRPT